MAHLFNKSIDTTHYPPLKDILRVLYGKLLLRGVAHGYQVKLYDSAWASRGTVVGGSTT